MSTPTGSAKTTRSTKAKQPVRAVPFRVFIAYADLTAFRRASATVGSAARESHRAIVIEPMLWRFDQLESSHWRDRAVSAAMDADVVVLASSSSAPFTPAIEAWVATFLHANRGRRATLVAIAGETEAWTISIEQPRVPAAHGSIVTAPWHDASVAA